MFAVTRQTTGDCRHAGIARALRQRRNRAVTSFQYGVAAMATRSSLRTQRTDLLEYVGRQVRDSVLSEDIVQEAYLRFLTFEGKPGSTVTNAPALLRRISLNLIRDHFDVTPVFHPAATRDRPVLSRMSAVEATGGVNPARCCSSPAANAAGVA